MNLRKSQLLYIKVPGIFLSFLLFAQARLIALIPFATVIFLIYRAASTQQGAAYIAHLTRLFYQPWVRLLSGILLWIFLSTFWSCDIFLSLQTFGKAFAYAASFLCLIAGRFLVSTEDVSRLLQTLFLIFITLCLLNIIDYSFGLKLTFFLRGNNHYAFNHKSLYLAFCLFPFASFWIKQRWTLKKWQLFMGSTFPPLGYIIFFKPVQLFSISITYLSFLTSWLSMSILPWRKLLRIFSILFFVCGTSLPFVFSTLSHKTLVNWSQHLEKLSHVHRLFIYKKASDEILKKPLLGHGVEICKTERLVENIVLGDILSEKQPALKGQKENPLLKHHPHNFILQWWLELGAIGALLILSLCVYGILHLKTTSPFISLMSMMVFIPFLVISMFSYGFWQSWILGIFSFTLFVYQLCLRTLLENNKRA